MNFERFGKCSSNMFSLHTTQKFVEKDAAEKADNGGRVAERRLLFLFQPLPLRRTDLSPKHP